MAVGKKPAAAPLKGKKKPATFVIDCAKPVEDKIMKIGEFEKFLLDKIKVDNKAGASLARSAWCQHFCSYHSLRSSGGLRMESSSLISDGVGRIAEAMFLLAGVLGDNVVVSKDKTKVTVTSEIHMSKR